MLKNTITLVALCVALLFTSCSKKDSSPTSTTGTSPNTPPALSIAQFSPQETEVDSLVTITGTGFSTTTTDNTVTFNDTLAVVKSAWETTGHR